MTRDSPKPIPGRRRAVLAMAAGALSWRFGFSAAASITSGQLSVTPSAPAPVIDHDSRVTQFAPVVPGYRIRFPQDEASHPDFRTEWWYITGWLKPSSSQAAGGAGAIGFQLTFFRTRAEIDERNPSAFTPRQIMIAHAALSDRARGRLVSDEKVARSAFGLAGAEEARTHVWIDDWMLAQEGLSYVTHIPAREFAMALRFTQTQLPLLQGEDGFSRKGPSPESASYYYSVPHLRVEGTLVRAGRRSSVSGTAWLDHEWSSSYMDERAAGWDWVGINFDDGGALMAFRMRDRAGRKFWAGGAYRSADGTRRTFSEGEVEFVPLRAWRSPRTGTSYPVAWRVEVPAMTLTIEPLMDDQEHDTRVSVGTVYWEGAVVAHRNGKPAGRGYLELTGYWRPFRV